MAIKINTSYKEVLTSAMLNEKVHNVVGGNEKLYGFDVTLKTSTSVDITPGKVLVNGCAIEETSDIQTVNIANDILSVEGIAYIVLSYSHETKSVLFTCSRELTSSMVKLASVSILNGVITDIINSSPVKQLNSVAGQIAELEAQRIRDIIPSGFVKLGELDYEYAANNEMAIKFKSESIAYINGYRVEIPSNTIVEIGLPPNKKKRDDLLFLEAWKDDDFNKDGKLKWKIRHIKDVDFNSHADGLRLAGEAWTPLQCYAMGASSQIPPIQIHYCFTQANHRGDLDSIFGGFPHIDKGLFIAGTGNETSKKIFKTVDGYVYAIPMFKIHRKPSHIKSRPFEYNKINPLVNNEKFANLTKEDNIEKINNITIKGNTLINISKTKSYTLRQNLYNAITFDNTFKINTEYTLSFKVKSARGTIEGKNFRLSLRPRSDQDGVSTANDIVFDFKKLTTNNDERITFVIPAQTRDIVRLYLNINGADSTVAVELYDFVIIEGNLEGKDIPCYFDKLHSLGQDKNNTIVVKSGILDEHSYDPKSGNVKLSVIKGTNNINSDNKMTPEVEFDVKKDDTILSTKTSFGKIDNLTGDEILEFSKIKGMTLQNLMSLDPKDYNSLDPSLVINKDGFIYATAKGKYLNFFLKRLPIFKSSTKYTLIIDITMNTLNGKCYFNSDYPDSKTLFENKFVEVVGGTTGVIKRVLTSRDDLSGCNLAIRGFVDSVATSGAIQFRYMIFEGDYTDVNIEKLGYIDGIESVGEKENNKILLSRKGSNLFDVNSLVNFSYGNATPYLIDDYPVKFPKIIDNSTRGIGNIIKVTPKTTYTFCVKNRPANLACGIGFYSRLEDCNNIQKCISKSLFVVNISGDRITIQAPDNAHYMLCGLFADYDHIIAGNTITLNSVPEMELVVGDQPARLYEKFNNYNKIITLKQPLRSMGADIYDYIEGNKVIRKVGHMVLNGTENIAPNTSSDDYIRFVIEKNDMPSLPADAKVLSDRFPSNGDRIDKETVFAYTATGIVFCIKKSDLPTPNVAGFKTWLSQNPTSVYYQRNIPGEELIEPNYDKESIRTYQLDAPLRSLPNGANDEIIGNKLIRRCGERIFNGSENWMVDDVQFYVMNQNTKYYKANSSAIATNLNIDVGNNYFPMVKFTENPSIAGKSLEEFKTYLSQNPIKVVYELPNPMEITLEEEEANKADFSLKRQFSDGNWLKELPDGTKDTIENGLVIRRIGKFSITGKETFLDCKVDENYYEFKILSTSVKTVPQINSLCNTMPQSDYFRIVCAENVCYIRFPKWMNITTPQACKEWFLRNETIVYYPLETIAGESLSENNNNYYPYHKFNSYCGNVYIGNGRVDVYVDNNINLDKINVETDTKHIESSSKISDCNYKRTDNGYNDYYVYSASKNIACINKDNISLGNILTQSNGWVIGVKFPNFNYEGNGRAWCKQLIPVETNTKYTFYSITDEIQVSVQEYDSDLIDIVDNGWRSSGYSFTTSSKTKYIGLYLRKSNNSAISYPELYKLFIDTIQIEKGSFTSYESCKPIKKVFANTSNDDIVNLRHQVSLSGFDYTNMLKKEFNNLLKGDL